MMKKMLMICFCSFFAMQSMAEELRIFAWDGYVLPEEVASVNALLKDQGLDVTVKVIDTLAEGPEQMYQVLRSGEADVSFLTLNYIMMQNGKTAQLLQPINVDSPRLSNYSKLLDSLKHIPMGMEGDKPLYVPWGGGAYGIWADMNKLTEDELPHSVADLWDPKWAGKLSLSSGQFQPNIALALLALEKPAFHINDKGEDRAALRQLGDPNGEIQQKVSELYAQVGYFWETGPVFDQEELALFASYGIGASAENANGGHLRLVNFKEGNTVWLDTLNIHKDVSGAKLEAAEIFINHHIDKVVQERVAGALGMVAASSLAENNLLINDNPEFFSQELFWPPYNIQADNVMKQVSDRAMNAQK